MTVNDVGLSDTEVDEKIGVLAFEILLLEGSSLLETMSLRDFFFFVIIAEGQARTTWSSHAFQSRIRR